MLSRVGARVAAALCRQPRSARLAVRLSSSLPHPLRALDEFLPRHIGPRDGDIPEMLATISPALKSVEALIDETVPPHIRLTAPLGLAPPATETEALAELRQLAALNRPAKSLIGMGYYDTLTPAVITRNILENPVWYTSYSPYQAEISQGRLESLLNYQTMVCDLTGLDVANASLLDEATAAAEAMHLACTSAPAAAAAGPSAPLTFVVSPDVHPQTLAVVRTRAEGLGVRILVADPAAVDWAKERPCGVLLQYPNTHGRADAEGVRVIAASAHAAGALVVVATDLLACTLLQPPGELGADVAVGSAQRFGVPMGFGGPHAGFFAAKDAHKRKLPGRVIGVSVDAQGGRALRMAMQTREQHIRRDKATSNICTAQALLANMAAFYALYHGPEGLRAIAARVRTAAAALAAGLRARGLAVSGGSDLFFDTVTVAVADADAALAAAAARGLNLRRIDGRTVGVSLDEATSAEHVRLVLEALGGAPVTAADVRTLADAAAAAGLPAALRRSSAFLTHPVFSAHRSETLLMRYIHRLGGKDVSLTHSMIPLGSCTMKLNAAAEMAPVSWPELAGVHPFAPADQTRGWAAIVDSVSEQLARVTGFAAVSVQPNSGAAGEYAGLMAIRAFLQASGQGHRDVCLIPVSAHGTNPASAVMAGMRVVVVKSDEAGNVDWADLQAKAAVNADRLAALMVTYPSTYGVFEERVKDFSDLVHRLGGQVYMDGANLNAQVGLTSPALCGADVCHLNLHKTFCIPHGGGGPGVGAIGVAAHLAPFLPGHPVVPTAGWQGAMTGAAATLPHSRGAVAAAPFGSALILPISWMYIRMLGGAGLLRATQLAILNANYLAARLGPHYPLLFRGVHGRVAHELIIDLRPFKARSGGLLGEEDVAKRLMDYGFHSPTMSWPVPGTLMIEPTESESRAELDRFADALIAIRGEIEDVLSGRVAAAQSPLKHAPHTAAVVTGDAWEGRAYSRATAAFPAPWVKECKIWPTVGRVDNVHGDRHLVCTCPPVESYAA